jgi:hypothetical protein
VPHDQSQEEQRDDAGREGPPTLDGVEGDHPASVPGEPSRVCADSVKRARETG